MVLANPTNGTHTHKCILAIHPYIYTQTEKSGHAYADVHSGCVVVQFQTGKSGDHKCSKYALLLSGIRSELEVSIIRAKQLTLSIHYPKPCL